MKTYEKYNSSLIEFLNKHIPSEIEEIVSIKLISVEIGPLYSLITKETTVSKKWNLEVLCKSDRIDECIQFKILETLPKYIKLFGESCETINAEVTYMV